MKDKQYKQKISPEKCNTETKTPTNSRFAFTGFEQLNPE